MSDVKRVDQQMQLDVHLDEDDLEALQDVTIVRLGGPNVYGLDLRTANEAHQDKIRALLRKMKEAIQWPDE